MIVVLDPNPSGRRATEVGSLLADSGTPVRVVVPRTSWDAFAGDARAAFGEASWVVMAGSLPRGAPLYGPAELIPQAREAGAGVLVDLRGEVLGSALVSGPDIAVISAREAATALGRSLDGPDAAVEAAKEFLRGAGAQTMLVVVRGRRAFAVARRSEPTSGVRPSKVQVGPSRFLADLARHLDAGRRDVMAVDLAVSDAEATLE